MDVDRYEQDVAALTPGHGVSDLTLSGIDRNFGNATLYTWTAGLERKFGNLTADASYVGTGRKASADQLSQWHIPAPIQASRPSPPSIAPAT
jgi:protein-arginine kinase